MNSEKRKRTVLIVIIVILVLAILAAIMILVTSNFESNDKEDSKQDIVTEEEVEKPKKKPKKEKQKDEPQVTQEVKAEPTEKPQKNEKENIEKEHMVVTQTNNLMEYIDDDKPFYGIWIGTSGMYRGAEEIVLSDTHQYPMHIILTSEWSNLNPEPYYAVSIFKYETKEEAEDYLAYVKEDYPDAYVKYTGEKIGGDIKESYYMTVYDPSVIEIGDTEVIIYATDEKTGDVVGYVVDEKTVFDADAEMDYFDGYSEGESVLEWYKKMSNVSPDDINATALSGVFEVSLTGNHIDVFYNSMWWD